MRRSARWETTSTITSCEPQRFSATTSMGRTDDRRRPGGSRWSRPRRHPTHTVDADGSRAQWYLPAIDAMPDKESKILHRRLGEHRANMEATLAGIKALAEA